MSLSNLGLDAFEVIAECGTLVLAAEKLGLTQTALTQRIKSLESELETSLFLRSRKGMALTREGKLLQQYCAGRKQRERLVLNQIRGLGDSEPLRIRITGPTLQTESRFFETLTLLRKKHRNLTFNFEIDDSSDLGVKLRNDEADLVLTSARPHPSFPSKELTPSEFILVGPAEWKGREMKEIIAHESIIDFNAKDTYTVDFLSKNKLRPKHLPERHFINNTHQMLMLVESGLGYAVFDVRHVEAKIRAKKLINIAPHIRQKTSWFLSWSDHGEEMNPVLAELIDLVK